MITTHQMVIERLDEAIEREGGRDVRLVHYSKKPLTEVRSAGVQPISDKPQGLWVSAIDHEMHWREWCEGEDFGFNRFKFEQEIRLSPDARILHIADLQSFDAFSRGYWSRAVPPYDKPLFKDCAHVIDWPRLAEHYDGIIIAPYQWERRLTDHRWYYGWDCASGVVWRSRAVESIGPAIPVQFGKEAANVAA